MLEFEQRPNHASEEAPETEPARDLRITPGKLARTTRLYRDAVGRGPNGPLAGVLATAAASRGKPLPAELRRRLEQALRADLSAVRIHTTSAAADAATALGANAFTVGNDVYFAAGTYDPTSERGQRLIAHEVAHVVQTGGVGPALDRLDDVQVSDPDERAEVDAHNFADAFVARGPREGAARPSTATPAPAVPVVAARGPATVIQRDARPPGGGANTPPALTPEQEAQLQRQLASIPSTPPAGGAPGATAPTTTTAADDGHGRADPRGAHAAEARGPGAGPDARGPGGGPGAGGGAGTRGGAATRGGTGNRGGGADGGGGGSSATGNAAPAPSADAAPHTPGAAPDGLVDYYMETHWSDARFMGLVAEHGYPGSAPKNVMSELDRWMPTDTPPSVRSTVNLVAGIGLGVFDSLFWSGLKAIPIIGPSFAIIDTFRQVSESVGKYQEVGDWGGGALAVLRAICDGGASIADNVSNTAGFIEGACFIIAGILGIGAVATALAGIGIAVGAVAAVVAEIGLVCKTVKVVARLISAALNGVKVVLDYVLLLHNASKAEEAEAAGDFERAGKYKQLMQGNAVDLVTDGIATVADSVEGIIGVMGMGSGPSTVAKIGTKIGGEAFGLAADQANKWRKAIGKVGRGLGGGANPADGINGGREGTGGALDDLLDVDVNVPIMVPTPIGAIPIGSQTVNLADQMRTSDRYVDPNAVAAASGAIGAARQQTVEQLNNAQQGLGTEPISWYQKLVNEILTPPTAPNTATAIADAMKPSQWITSALSGMRHLLSMAGAGTLDSIAGAADTAGGWLTSKLQPMIGQINQFLATAKPRMQQMLENANQQIQQSQLNLERVRNLISTLENGAAKVAEITSSKGVIEQKYQELMTKADSFRVSRSSLGLPASIPIPFVDGRIDSAIAGVNAPINAFKAAVTAVKTAIIDRIAAAVNQAAQWVQQKMATFRRQLSEGGAAHTTLVTQYNNFKQLFARATRAFASWDGQIPNIDLSGAGAYLRQIAAASRRAKEIEAGQRPDPWKDIAKGEGQTFVNSWRGQHGDQLRTLYQPRPNPAEMAAVNSLYSSVRPRATGAAAQRLDEAYRRCQAASGQPGRRGLYALWQAENDLIAAANAAAVAPPPSPAPAPGARPPAGSPPGGPPPGGPTTQPMDPDVDVPAGF